MNLTSLQKLKPIALTCAEDSCTVIQVSLLLHFTFCLCKQARVNWFILCSSFSWSFIVLCVSHFFIGYKSFVSVERLVFTDQIMRLKYAFGFAGKRISFDEFFNHKFLATTRSTLYSGGSVHPYAMFTSLFSMKMLQVQLNNTPIPCCLSAAVCAYIISHQC